MLLNVKNNYDLKAQDQKGLRNVNNVRSPALFALFEFRIFLVEKINPEIQIPCKCHP